MVNQPSTDIYANTRIWFTRVRPEPTEQHFHSQLGCHFEEIAEMIDELAEAEPGSVVGVALFEARQAIHALAEQLKLAAKHDQVSVVIRDRTKFLDSIADQAVTGCGAAHCAGMDPLNALHQVNVSNWSKFGDDGKPIYDENMKMTKGPNYVEADLSPYV